MPHRRDSLSLLHRRLRDAGLLLFSLALAVFPARSATASKKFMLEKNRPLTLDLSVGEVKVSQVLFEFPSSVMRLETANKVRVTVTNSSPAKVRVGLALALFDPEGNLVAAGSGGNKGGTIGPGETQEFSVFFYYVSERITSAESFHITLEVR